MFNIFPTARLRPSPFLDAAVMDGLQTVSLYNRMILPAHYGDPVAEYWRLINGVSMWDVGAQRQVEITGPGAGHLAQILSVRNLSNCKPGQGKYVAMCNHAGTIINDPVVLKHDDDRFWFSIADSDVWLWARAIGAERGLDVTVGEPDVSPLAVQGPKAEDVVASIFGNWVRDLKYFWFKETELEGIPVAVQRSGWSKQGGFEIYLKDSQYGTKLWDLVKEAGRPFDIGPGSPLSPERVESGLVSIGGDTDGTTNPFEIRWDRFVDLEMPEHVIGVNALRKIKKNGVKRRQLGVILEGDKTEALAFKWEPVSIDGRMVGKLTNCVWSPRLEANIGYVLVDAECEPETQVFVSRNSGPVAGRLVGLPFI